MGNNTELKIINNFLVKIQRNIDDLDMIIDELRRNENYDKANKMCGYRYIYGEARNLMIQEVISSSTTTSNIKEDTHENNLLSQTELRYRKN